MLGALSAILLNIFRVKITFHLISHMRYTIENWELGEKVKWTRYQYIWHVYDKNRKTIAVVFSVRSTYFEWSLRNNKVISCIMRSFLFINSYKMIHHSLFTLISLFNIEKTNVYIRARCRIYFDVFPVRTLNPLSTGVEYTRIESNRRHIDWADGGGEIRDKGTIRVNRVIQWLCMLKHPELPGKSLS